jgi:hypothetical protein
MPSSPQVTELAVFHVNEAVDLENVASSNPSPAVQAFIQMTNTIKAQRGFIRQFWVSFSTGCLYDGAERHRVMKSNTQISLFGLLVSHFWTASGRPPTTHSSFLINNIDWESFEYHTTFVNSEEYTAFKAGLSQLFDLKVDAPITRMMSTLMYSG